MNDQKYRQIVVYKNYFNDFFVKLNPKVRNKVLWTFRLIETMERVPSEYLKKIEGASGLFEIRIKSGTDIFRVFCFFDKLKIVVLLQGFQKKTRKTPSLEIVKALKIKEEYDNER